MLLYKQKIMPHEMMNGGRRILAKGTIPSSSKRKLLRKRRPRRMAVMSNMDTIQLGSGLKDIVKGVKKVGKFLKDTKAISKGADLAEALGVPGASTVKNIAGAIGLGKRRMRGRGGTLASRRGIQGRGRGGRTKRRVNVKVL